MQRLWMSQSCFSLGFLSQNSLRKLSIIRGYKGHLCWCVFWNVKGQVCNKQGGLAAWPRDLIESRV